MKKITFTLVIFISFILLYSIAYSLSSEDFIPLDIVSNYFNQVFKSLGIIPTAAVQEVISSQEVIPSYGTIFYSTCNKNAECESGETVWNCCPDCGVPSSGCDPGDVKYWYTCDDTTPTKYAYDCDDDDTACSVTGCSDDNTKNGTYTDYWCNGGICESGSKTCYEDCPSPECCLNGGCVPEGTLDGPRTCSNSTWAMDLTADSLLECAKNKNIILHAYLTGCYPCQKQKEIFLLASPPAGPATLWEEFETTNVIYGTPPPESPCGWNPCWAWGSTAFHGCRTLPQLNNNLECGLEPIPDHVYRLC